MSKTTALYEKHLAQGALMVDFAGWKMPLHYGSQIEEHHQVRKNVGMFDVSHMLSIDIDGKDAEVFLRTLLTNDVIKLAQAGKALYSCMLNEEAGVLDDLIVYRLGDTRYRCVVNSATAEKDLHWFLEKQQSSVLTIQPRFDLAMLAIQGPKVFEKMNQWVLKPFHVIEEGNWLIARTGYTGEDGLEIMLPANEASGFWDKLIDMEIAPIGLGARDTLRLEAGFNLYGQDMDESVTPLESNLGWTVDWKDPERNFIGKQALLAQKNNGLKYQLIGLVMEEKGICRAGMRVFPEGTITSGSFSPTLSCGIGFARIPIGDFSEVAVDIRGKKLKAKVIKPPFVKKGKPNF